MGTNPTKTNIFKFLALLRVTTANQTTVTHQIGLVVPKASNQDTWYNHISKRIHSMLTLFLLRGSPEVGGAFVDSGGVPQFSLPTSDTMKSTEIMAWLHQNGLYDGNFFVRWSRKPFLSIITKEFQRQSNCSDQNQAHTKAPPTWFVCDFGNFEAIASPKIKIESNIGLESL